MSGLGFMLVNGVNDSASQMKPRSSERSGPDMSQFVVTSNRGFAAYAQNELRALVPGASFVELSPAEVYRMRLPLKREEAIRVVCGKEPVFLRHWFPIDAEVELSGQEGDIVRIVERAAHLFALEQVGMSAAVQVRKAESFTVGYEPGAVREALAQRWRETVKGETVAKDADRIVSVYVSEGTAMLGVSESRHNLSDWSGGAVRFRREEGQVSRAKFKLLEAEYAFGLDLTRYARALDIGAAPGGWTSLLLERGAAVTAVDPADLSPSLLGHPQLTYYKKNAGQVSFKDNSFDLLVCDMSWSPRQMVKLLISLLPALRPGGMAVVTLKLMHGKPFQTLKDSVRALAPWLDLRHAKQLFHNRDEMTVVLEKSR